MAPGRWDVERAAEDGVESPFAALVVDGLMTRECLLAGTLNVEIVGPGDVVDAWSAKLTMMPLEVRWTALTTLTVAVLERHFLAAVRRWPILALRLFERAAEQNARASTHAAINAIRNVEQRILAMLWHLASLYGKVRPDGVLVPMRLSHEAIGRMIGARRPTVTLAMKALTDQRLLTTEGVGGFLLSTGSRSILVPDPAGAPPLNGTGISLAEPIRSSRRPSTFGGDDAETRSLGRLREEISLLRESETELRALFELAGIGVARLEAHSGLVLNLNRRLAAMLGSTKKELLETRLWDRVHPDDRVECRERLASLVAGRVNEVEVELRLDHDGGWVWTAANFALLDAPDAANAKLIAVIDDITEVVQARIRQAFVLALSDELRPLSDPVEIQAKASEILGEHLGASRVFYGEVSEDGGYLVVDANYVRAGEAAITGSFRMGDFGDQLLGALLDGRTISVRDISASTLLSGPERDAYAELGIAALAGVPLLKHGRFVADISVHQSEPRDWSPAELALIEETAERTWGAVQRSRAEQALRTSEQRYRTLFEAINEGFAVCELVRDEHGRPIDYRFLEANRAAAALIGSQPGAILARHTSRDRLRPDTQWIELFARVVETDAPARLEAHVPRLDQWFDVRCYPHGGDRFAILFDDTTARNQAEKALRESEARHRAVAKELEQRALERAAELQASEQRFGALVEATAAIVWTTDRDGRVVADSPSWRAFTGQTLEDWLDTGWIAAIHPDDRQFAEHNWRRAVREQTDVDTHFRIWHAAVADWQLTQSAPFRCATTRASSPGGPD